MASNSVQNWSTRSEAVRRLLLYLLMSFLKAFSLVSLWRSSITARSITAPCFLSSVSSAGFGGGEYTHKFLVSSTVGGAPLAVPDGPAVSPGGLAGGLAGANGGNATCATTAATATTAGASAGLAGGRAGG